jgi:TonB-dependent Receptor Plug Domain
VCCLFSRLVLLSILIGSSILYGQSATATLSGTVSDSSGAYALKSESGERSQVITNQQVMDLALNGRNVLDLMKTLPGVVSNLNAQVYNEGGLDQFNINGTRGNEKQEMVDGTSNLIAGANNRTQVTINPDAIAELKIW